ncbi:hypothetical protein [Anabaena azotica]|uniref:Uncharacterized protein n=1 Tax=Anabaena azotica FACHB-119 TaxID=947527 RepID=A0ABR8D2A4_9NOST|nr:hypothetical protein [Anabaena azotica]MBD2499868.1 hypothetical protein [Anabaena azotica FACHB-119]
MPIRIVSKSDKKLSQLKDAIRILAWEQYKIDNKKAKGLEGYELFNEEWKDHEIHNMDQNEFNNFIKDLGYTEADLVAERSRYYQNRNQINGTASVPATPQDIEMDNDDNYPPY